MKIVQGFPPNIELIQAGLEINDTAVFAYGDTVYNPYGHEIHADIMAHEEVHQRQQGSDPQWWWNQYLIDPKFRLSQEIEAYAVQFAFVRARVKDRNLLYSYLFKIAIDLSSPIYGRLISHSEAQKKIKEHAKTLLP